MLSGVPDFHRLGHCGCISRVVCAQGERRRDQIRFDDIEDYASSVTVRRNVGASAPHRALAAPLFLRQTVLKKELERPEKRNKVCLQLHGEGASL